VVIISQTPLSLADLDKIEKDKQAAAKAKDDYLFGGDGASKILDSVNYFKTEEQIKADKEAGIKAIQAADNRSLSEILASNAADKQSEWEEKFLKNRAVSPFAFLILVFRKRASLTP